MLITHSCILLWFLMTQGQLMIDFNCILNIKYWMAKNVLQLNQDKPEVLIIGPLLV